MSGSRPVSMLFLSLCFLGSGAFLAIVNAIALPVLQKNARHAQQALLGSLTRGTIAAAKTVDSAEVQAVYTVYENGQLFYALDLRSHGYGGPMRILALYNAQGALARAVLAEHSETPGIGGAAASPAYMQRFAGLGAAGSPLPQEPEDALNPEALSGATVTFHAVSRALRAGSDFIKKGGF